MDRAEIEARLREVLVTELGLDADKINTAANFEQDLDVDSLGVVELLMAMEDEFGVKIPDDEAEHIHTVGRGDRARSHQTQRLTVRQGRIRWPPAIRASNSQRRRVVVTGMGVISPVGNDVESFWKSIAEGRSGIGPITRFDASAMRTRIAGEVKGYDPEDYFDRKRRAPARPDQPVFPRSPPVRRCHRPASRIEPDDEAAPEVGGGLRWWFRRDGDPSSMRSEPSISGVPTGSHPPGSPSSS